MALVVTSYSAGVDFGTSTTDKTWAAGDAAIGNDTTTSYRNLTIPAGITMTLGLRAILKISGTLTVAGTIIGSKTGTGAGTGNNGSTAYTFRTNDVTRTVGNGGGGGGHRFVGGFNYDVNEGGGNRTYGGPAYDNVTALNASSSFSAQLQSGSSGGYGVGTGGGAGGGPGSGGGSFRIMAKEVIVNGEITAAGQGGFAGTGGTFEAAGGGGGGGSGGTVWIIAGRVSGSGNINASGGAGGSGGIGNQGTNGTSGGGGSCGFVRVDAGIFGTSSPTTTSTRWTEVSFQNYYENVSGITTTGTYVTSVEDATAPVFSNLSKSVTTAGPNQNQVVTVTITDSQTTVQTPTATLSGSGIGGTVTLTSFTSNSAFTSGVAIFTISSQTGSGTATLTISATDSGGNTSTTATTWTVDSSYPAGFVPFFGSGTADWILDGNPVPSLTYYPATKVYAVTDTTHPVDSSYSLYIRNLTINNTYSLIWSGALTLYVSGSAVINGTLGWNGTTQGSEGTKRGGGGQGGLGGNNSSYSVYFPENDLGGWGSPEGRDWPAGQGWTAEGVWTTVAGAGDHYNSEGNYQPTTASSGQPGGHAWKIPLAADSYSDLLTRGVAVGAGGGGGGRGSYSTGGNGGWGGAALILKAQTLSGSGSINADAQVGDGRNSPDGGSGGRGGAGHIAVIAGTSNFSAGTITATPTGSGYISYYYNTGSTPGTVNPAIINTTKIYSTIPATISDIQSSAGASISYQYAKSGTVQRISVNYSKTMSDSTIKIALSGAATLASTTMTKNTSLSNTYYYDYTCASGNGTITYTIDGKDLVNNPAATISGAWVLDNTAAEISTSISPNKKYFSPGETVTVTATITEANFLNGNPIITLTKGSNYFGQDPPAVTLTYSSFSGSTYTYTGSFTVPVASGSLSSSVSVADFAGNTTSYSGLISLNTGLIISQASSIIWF